MFKLNFHSRAISHEGTPAIRVLPHLFIIHLSQLKQYTEYFAKAHDILTPLRIDPTED